MSSKVILVFGERNRGHRLSEESHQRLIKALQIYEQGDVIVLMGGLFSEQQYGVTVAEAMKVYIERCVKKVSQSDIFIEGESLTTIQNIFFACQKFTATMEDGKKQKVIVSSAYHVPRCWLVCALIGGFCPKIYASGSVLRGLNFKTVATEIVGIFATITYAMGIGFLEKYVRRKRHGVFRPMRP